MNCPLLYSSQSSTTNDLKSYSFTVISVLSFNYLGFYSKLNTSGTLDLAISSTINCISGYQYSTSESNCIAVEACPTG